MLAVFDVALTCFAKVVVISEIDAPESFIISVTVPFIKLVISDACVLIAATTITNLSTIWDGIPWSFN